METGENYRSVDMTDGGGEGQSARVHEQAVMEQALSAHITGSRDTQVPKGEASPGQLPWGGGH